MQGYYLADGKDKLLEVPFDANWLKIVNLTVTEAAGADELAQAYWQDPMVYGVGYIKLAADESLSSIGLAAATGITKINTGDNPLDTINTTGTAISNAAIPIVSATSTTGLVNGSIVRFQSVTGGTQLDGMDFSIDTVVANTSFRLPYMAQIVAAGANSFYRVKYDKLWYPRTRFISSITQASSAVIELTVAHDYAVGDYVRIMVPDTFGMKEMNLAEARITAIDTTLNTITVNIDSTGYTAFAFPVTGTELPTYAEVVPLSGPVTNVQFRGFELKAGATAAGGVANDEIYWVAGDSFGI